MPYSSSTRDPPARRAVGTLRKLQTEIDKTLKKARAILLPTPLPAD